MPLLFLFFVLPIFAQDLSPQWVEESWRLARYPKSEWYTGFARDKIKGQPNRKDYEAIEKAAQSKLSENIQVQVQSSANVQTTSKQTQNGNNSSETINTNYKQAVTTQSNLVLAKVDVKSYFDKKSGEIYAFASVKKSDLADFYRSKITHLFSYAEKELSIAEQLAEAGKKNAALSKIQVVEDTLKNVGFWGSLLQTVESDNSHTAQETAFGQRANNAKMLLQNSTVIYLDISSNKQYSDMGEKLGAQMQEKGCNCTITNAKQDADYSVAIKAKFGSCNKAGDGIFYCYANADVTVNNQKYKKPVNVKVPEAKGGWTNGDRAMEEAFKELANSMAEKIVQTINQ